MKDKVAQEKPRGKKRAGRQGKRLTIGFLLGHLKYLSSCRIWEGVVDVAREREVNVISFLAGDLDTPVGFDAQGNVLYDMVNPDMLDGLVVWVTRLTEYAGPEGAERVLERYRAIPIVTIERGGPEDMPWVDVDSYQAVREMMAHLIREHGRRRIAFVRGPDETHAGARARYQAYLDGLTEAGLSFDPDLVSPPTEGVWWAEAGEEAVALWLDQRRVSFDAVIGANDDIAINAMQALQDRGIHMPKQVAVVGFDDDVGSDSTIPPLTTIQLQGYEMGRRATGVLLTLLEGGQAPERASLSPKLVVRQSCGCADPAVAQAAVGPVTIKSQKLKMPNAAQREKILSEMRRAAGRAAEGLDRLAEHSRQSPDWTEQLLEAFWAELKADQPGVFLAVLEEVLRWVIAVGGQVQVWENVILTLRRAALPHLGSDQVLRLAEDLWLQAQIMIRETAQIAQKRESLQVTWRGQVLDEVGEALTTTFDVDGLMSVLIQELRRLSIPGCYLSLYENPQRPAEMSRLILAYDERRGWLEPEAGQQVFPSRCLVPEGMLPQGRPYHMVVEPLYFREDQLGLALFEMGPREGIVYETLRGQISCALRGALLVRRVQERSAELARQQYILDTFMETIPDRIYFKDMESRFTRANQAHAARLGLSDPAEEIGKSDFDFFPEEQAQVKYGQEQEIIRTGQPLLNLEERDSTGRWALTTKMPLRDENGEIIGTFGISHDITAMKKAQAAMEKAYAEVEQRVEERTQELQQEIAERKSAEEELQRYREHLEDLVEERTRELQKAQAELVRQERLSALGQLTATVAHEIRNPLGTVRTSVFAISDAIERDEMHRVEHALQLAERNIVRCDAIITELLDYTRDRVLQLKPTCVNAWLDRVLDEVLDQQTIPEGIVCVKNLEASAEVLVDSEYLRRAIINVVNNAADAMRDDVTRSAEGYPAGPAGLVEEEKLLTVSTHVVMGQADSRLEIRVSDTGCGIPDEVKDKLFEPLFSTKSFGVGLGLPIVKAIMEQHNGGVEISSQAGVGTTVVLWLPMVGNVGD